MRLQCRISGIEYEIPATFGNYQHSSIHPAFDLPVKFLFSRAGDWAAGKLNITERKLIFLALLNSTELVHFKTAAYPSDMIVQQNMEHAFKIVSWILGIKTPSLSLPQFVVNMETREMLNIKHWLTAWEDARKDFEDGYKSQTHLAKLRNREYALERLIKNAQRKVEDYAGLLSSWAFEAASVPEYLRPEWRKIFLAKGIDTYSIRQADVVELIEHMEEHLDHGSIYSNAVLRHIRLVAQKNKQGLSFGLGMLDSEFNNLDLDALVANPFKIVTDSVEGANIDAAISTAPESMPVEKDYPSRVAFLRAKVRWEMAEKARAYAEEFTTKVEVQLEIDSQLNDEYAEDNLDEDHSGKEAELDQLIQDQEGDQNEQ